MEKPILTRKMASLLRYVETVCVDYGGMVDSRKINDEEREILRQWDRDGFITYKRLTSESIVLLSGTSKTHRATLSEEAWELAHASRKECATQMLQQEPYNQLKTTEGV